MGWNHKVGAVERIVEFVAALSLSAGAGFAAVMLAPLAGPVLIGAAAGGALVAGGGALLLLGRVDPLGPAAPEFALADLPDAGEEVGDELLLDDPIRAPGPIEAPDADSRVVQLFGDEPLPAPGELVTRIADFLESGRGPVREQVASNEASAALHAALADIRRSLR
jgi:hypothetical protein